MLLVALQSACAAAGPAKGPPARASERDPGRPEPSELTLPRIVVSQDETATIDELYAHAEQRLLGGAPGEAAVLFVRVFELDPDGPRAAEALYRAAEALDAQGEVMPAAQRLEQLIRRYPDNPLARHALADAVRVYAVADQWRRAGEAARLLMARYDDLAPVENILARGGLALAEVEAGQLDAAAVHVSQGRTVLESLNLDGAGRLPKDTAPLFFALGEIRRLRAEHIRFVPYPPDFLDRLERRCQLLLDAQSAYSDVMRAYDAHWSAKAGYRVGELYHRLHSDLLRIPAPAAADTDARRQLFEGAMRLRYAILLQKARSMMDHTLAMAQRTGEQSAWVVRAEQASLAIARDIRTEQEAIDRLPYSRAELQAALDDLARRRSP